MMMDEGLSEYERKRASIIAANKIKLAELMPFAMDDVRPAASKTARPSPKRAKEYTAQLERPKRVPRSSSRQPFSFSADHFWPDPVPKIRKPERKPESRGSSSDKMSDRLEKSSESARPLDRTLLIPVFKGGSPRLLLYFVSTYGLAGATTSPAHASMLPAGMS